MKITHWNPKINERLNRPAQARTEKGRFARKISPRLALFMADCITILVMSVMIANAFMPKTVQGEQVLTASSPKVQIVSAKEQVIQQQIDMLTSQLNSTRKTELSLQ